jgi:hypothetical protein
MYFGHCRCRILDTGYQINEYYLFIKDRAQRYIDPVSSFKFQTENMAFKNYNATSTIVALIGMFIEYCRSDFKTSNRAEAQGTDRRKSAAYIRVCEHFKEVRNIEIRY